MAEQTRRRRDPQARRQAMVTAAAELISEVGVDALTHRMVAARASVPLGATTQYFDTLDDLRTAGLQHLAAEIEARIDEVHRALTAQGVTAANLAALIGQGLEDAHAVKADRAVVTAAVNDPRVRELASTWSEQMASFLAPTCGRERAAMAAIFIDGVLWHSLISDAPVRRDLIRKGLAAIMGEPIRGDDPG